MRLYKLTLSYGLKSYTTSRRPIGKREVIRHAAAVVGKLRAYTQKELETVRAAPELLGAPTSGGGSARPGVVVERFIEVIYTFTAARNSQKRRKTGGFAHVLANKSPKTPFFCSKVLNKKYS